MWRAPEPESLALRIGNVLRLPFELGTCFAAELVTRLLLWMDRGAEPRGKLRCPALSELMCSDPSAALCLALRPFLPAFQRSLTEQARSGRETLWAAYDTQAQAAAKLALETKWLQVVQAALRWLWRQARLLRNTDWRSAGLTFVLGVRQLFGLLSLLGGQRSVDREKVDAWLREVTAERDAAKALFQANNVVDAEVSYAAILEKMLTAEAQVQASAEFRAEHTRVLVNAALCQKKLKRFDKAVMTATKALVLEPECVKALFIRGTSHLEAGDIEQAVEDLSRAVALDPALDSARAELRKARAARARKGSTAAGTAIAPSKAEVKALLAEFSRVQGIVQQEVSVLAHKLVEERSAGSGQSLTFLEGHAKILQLGLPSDPLEDYGFNMESFQELLMDHQDDEEIMAGAARALNPPGKGDPERAQRITVDKIVEIHQVMVNEMQKVLDQFQQLPEEQRSLITAKGCENTAELLVSVAVEQRLGVRCEDVEQAVLAHESQLQHHADFAQSTEELARMMQELTRSPQDPQQNA